MAVSDHEKGTLLARASHVGLFSATPSDAGGGVELVGTGYSRQAVDWTVTNDLGSNATAIVFNNTGADWPAATHIGLFDAPSAGHLLHWASLSPFTLRAGRSFTIAPGDLQVGFP